jgi:fatty acid desaturase
MTVADVERGSDEIVRQRPADRYVGQYTELVKVVKASGLMRRRYAYYWTRMVAAVAVFAGVWVAVPLLGDSWFQLILAAVLGLVISQFGFLGHDGAHRQIFASAAWNDWSSRIISGAFVGLSFGWWKGKHSRHHAAPNQIDRDPDIASGVLAFSPEAASSRTGWGARVLRYQGWLLFPLLTLEGLNLQVDSVRALTRRRSMPHRWTEIALIGGRTVVYLSVLFLLLPPGKAFAFLGVQMAVVGIALGGAFVPNHTAMPIVPAGLKVDFLRRQVLMSRNITGGAVIAYLMGGLQHQIEHHLFPSMPRPNLAAVRPMVRTFCREHEIAYTEQSLVAAYANVLSYLNRVGLSGRNTFTCPLAVDLR